LAADSIELRLEFEWLLGFRSTWFSAHVLRRAMRVHAVIKLSLLLEVHCLSSYERDLQLSYSKFVILVWLATVADYLNKPCPSSVDPPQTTAAN